MGGCASVSRRSQPGERDPASQGSGRRGRAASSARHAEILPHLIVVAKGPAPLRSPTGDVDRQLWPICRAFHAVAAACAPAFKYLLRRECTGVDNDQGSWWRLSVQVCKHCSALDLRMTDGQLLRARTNPPVAASKSRPWRLRARVPVRTRDVATTPFCALVEFARMDRDATADALVVAPLSGHYPILMRDVVLDLIPSFRVYVTDWIKARYVSVQYGPFGLEANVSSVVEAIRGLRPGSIVVAVCQGGAAALAATAVLGAVNDPQAGCSCPDRGAHRSDGQSDACGPAAQIAVVVLAGEPCHHERSRRISRRRPSRLPGPCAAGRAMDLSREARQRRQRNLGQARL